jgi:hypothetical protein
MFADLSSNQAIPVVGIDFAAKGFGIAAECALVAK